MKASAAELLNRIPAEAGKQFAVAIAHGTMSVELYAPTGTDPQKPHEQDELYFIQAGSGQFLLNGERHPFSVGDCFFVPAGVEHRFENFTPDFATWVVFWGPKGGE
jgi:mannose-6-phosphate isomerase-like protein (cupin superfamily)